MSGAPARALEAETQVASTDELRAALANALRHCRPRASIVDVERTAAAYGSSWWLEDVEVHLDDGFDIALVYKDLGREANGSGARRIKPTFVTDPTREGWVYQTLLAGAAAGTPKLWAAVNDGAANRHWLLLERVHGVPLSQVGGRTTWCQVARWLGRFHHVVSVPQADGAPLLRHDSEHHRAWMRRALAATNQKLRLARLRALGPVHERAILYALSMGEKLIHGEFYPSNILVDLRGTTCRVHALDWEMAALGPQLLDLAALLSGPWSPDDRHAMAAAYRDAARTAGATLVPLDEFQRGLSACRLLLAVQWLGWARDWDPPADHRNDWLEEAERCAEELRS
jgi:hypothetical protein